MSTTSQPTQSTSDRKSEEAHLSTLIAKFASKHAQLISAARRSLRKHLPSAYEIVYEYRSWLVISISPSDRGYEGVFGIRADAGGVKLYFNQGKQLPDPEKLLKGSAQVRSIDLEDESTFKHPAVANLIDAAIARTRDSFAPDANGPVVIRSESTKKAQKVQSTNKAKAPAKKTAVKKTPTKKATAKKSKRLHATSTHPATLLSHTWESQNEGWNQLAAHVTDWVHSHPAR